MKKLLFLAAVATLAITSCTKTETIDQSSNAKAITFDTYIGKNVKGVPVNGTSFAEGTTMVIYATKDGASFMTDVVATKSASGWGYSPILYYSKDVDYVFTAYAPDTNPKIDISSGTIVGYTVPTAIADQVDFMYTPAAITRNWDGQAATVIPQVQFAFAHALAQVKFSAKSAADYSSQYAVKITNVTVKGVNSVGDLTLETSTWSNQSAPVDYAQSVADFTLSTSMQSLLNSKTPADNNVLMLIPQSWTSELEVQVTLDVTATAAGDVANNGEKTFTAKIPASAWERNKIYNYQMTLELSTILNMKEITFGDPSISVWDNTEVEQPVR